MFLLASVECSGRHSAPGNDLVSNKTSAHFGRKKRLAIPNSPKARRPPLDKKESLPRGHYFPAAADAHSLCHYCRSIYLDFVSNCLNFDSLFSLVCLCYTVKVDVPMSGWRLRMIRWGYSVATSTALKVLGISYECLDKDFDYTDYLGDNYLTDFKISRSCRCATYVLNHTGIVDIVILVAALKSDVTFVAGDFIKQMPFAGFLSRCFQCIFTPRQGDQEGRDHVVRIIEGRQRAVEEEGLYPPVAIFPEGMTSNNQYLHPFKKGAFTSERTIIPIILNYQTEGNKVAPFTDVITDF